MKTDRPRRRLRRGLLALAVLAALALFGYWQCWGVTVTDTEVTLAALPAGFDGLRIAHLSDLHGHEYGHHSSRLAGMVAEMKPDLIVITGDLVDRKSQLDTVAALIKQLTKTAPVYYVTGNHEWAAGCGPEAKALLKNCGATVLDNRFIALERDGDTIVLAGVDDPNGYADQKTPEALYAEIQAAHPGAFTILLAHRNTLFGQYAAAGYDLVLSGHAHGGIVRLPFTDGLIGTDRRLFPTWTSGVYREGESTLFVSRGLGNNTTPFPGFRLFNRPELAGLTLVRGSFF